MKEKNNKNEFELFLNSLDRSDLSEEEMFLLSSLGGESGTVINNQCISNNCQGGNCVTGCGS